MKINREAIVLLGFLFVTPAWAATRTEAVDENKDGRKETVYTYEDKQIIKAESDMNGDGKPDMFTVYKDGRRFSTEADKNFDGRIDYWATYDETGRLVRSSSDSNKDGKPDLFREYTKGRELITEELDTNYDGKIDKRRLKQWKPDKTIPIFANNRITRVPNPGYIMLWEEDDNNFDGRIDAYTERGKPVSSDRIGKEIASAQPAPAPQEPVQPSAGQKRNLDEEKIKRMNEVHGVA